MDVACRPFEGWSRTRNAFMYLDPPYTNNTHGHYNAVPSTGDFATFVHTITPHNRVMISKQDEPADIGPPSCYGVYGVRPRRSPQYATPDGSREIIAANY